MIYLDNFQNILIKKNQIGKFVHSKCDEAVKTKVGIESFRLFLRYCNDSFSKEEFLLEYLPITFTE